MSCGGPSEEWRKGLPALRLVGDEGPYVVPGDRLDRQGMAASAQPGPLDLEVDRPQELADLLLRGVLARPGRRVVPR